ncbi:MAG: ABC transporter ATP-binding protein [Clostridia bacterium]|nr:ABC transporter ATP-binding protein [Clostridia bacterium]
MKKEKPKYSALSTALWTWNKQWKYSKISLIILIVMIPLYVAQQFLALYIPKTVIAGFTQNKAYVDILLPVIILYAAIFVIESASNLLNIKFDNGYRKFRDSIDYLLSIKVKSVSYMKEESPKFRDLVNRAQQTLWNTGAHCPLSEFSSYIADLFKNILGYLLFGSVISTLNPWITILLTVTPFVHYFLLKWYLRYEFSVREERNLINRKLDYVVHNGRRFDSAKDIRIYGLGTWFKSTYHNLVNKSIAWNKKLMKKEILISISDLVIILLRDSIAYCFLISMALKGEITVDNFVLYFAVIGSFSDWVNGVVGRLVDIHSLSLRVNDLREVFDTEEDVRKEGSKKLSDINIPCKIEINNLSFRYEGAENDVLKNINLTVNPCEKLAIIGVNGAGKTTLIKNICGLYTPKEGSIKYSGIDSNELSSKDQYALFSVVFQSFEFFSTSIAEIVSSDLMENTDLKKAENCLKAAGLWEKIEALPDGINTPLNKQLYENGIELSGGEKQKLLLAKAIYKDAPILILDEPTAALDPIAESKMYLTYNELTKDKTSIYISHRLASTKFCDRIILIDKGEIIEEGTHEALMAKGGKYAEMYEVQSKYYSDNKESEANTDEA